MPPPTISWCRLTWRLQHSDRASWQGLGQAYRTRGDLVERQVVGERAALQVVPLVWVLSAAEGQEAALRIAEPNSGALVLTRAEGRQAEAAARQLESRAREAAEARVAELEAALKRRGGVCDGSTR